MIPAYNNIWLSTKSLSYIFDGILDKFGDIEVFFVCGPTGILNSNFD